MQCEGTGELVVLSRRGRGENSAFGGGGCDADLLDDVEPLAGTVS